MPQTASLRTLRMGTDLVLMHPAGVARLLRVLRARGYDAEPSDVERAYIAWSGENHGTCWHPIGPDVADGDLFTALMTELVEPGRDDPEPEPAAAEPDAATLDAIARVEAIEPAGPPPQPLDRDGLPPIARDVLVLIESFYRDRGYPPSPKEIAMGVGIPIDPGRRWQASARDVVKYLMVAGFIDKRGGAVRLTYHVARAGVAHA